MIRTTAGHLALPTSPGVYAFSPPKAQDRAPTAGDTRERSVYLMAYSNLSENAGHSYA